MVSVIGPWQIAAGWVTFGSCFVIGFGSGLALKGRDLLPEVIEHRVGRRVPVMGPPMHLAARDHVDARGLLFQDRRLHRAKLRVRDIRRLELAQRNEAIERLVPARDAMSADHGGRVFWVTRHRLSQALSCLMHPTVFCVPSILAEIPAAIA